MKIMIEIEFEQWKFQNIKSCVDILRKRRIYELDRKKFFFFSLFVEILKFNKILKNRKYFYTF